MGTIVLPGSSIEEIAAELTEAAMALSVDPGEGKTDPSKRVGETMEVYHQILRALEAEA